MRPQLLGKEFKRRNVSERGTAVYHIAVSSSHILPSRASYSYTVGQTHILQHELVLLVSLT